MQCRKQVLRTDLLSQGKKRYEIACYKNKVLEWRSGVETDLDNVLQIPNVFLSVGKGQVAPTQDLATSFGEKTPLNDIILEILKKGELQVGEKERQAELERVHNEVIDIVAGKLVDPNTKRVYTTGMIDKALDQLSSKRHQPSSGPKTSGSAGGSASTGDGEDNAEGKSKAKDVPTWTGVVTNRSAKLQALDAMKALIAHQPIPVARARMRLRITCATSILKQPVRSDAKANEPESSKTNETKTARTVKDRLLSYVEQVEKSEVGEQEWEVIGFVEPGAFRSISDFIGSQTRGKARAEVLDMAVINEGE